MISLNHAVPQFSAEATGGTVSLDDLAGQVVVLYFYPKDNTPGCTTESQDFAGQFKAFQQADATVLGVSRDSIKSHDGFKAKLGLPFELIADPDETLCQLFGVMKMKNMYGKQVRGIERSTFLIDAKGQLAREWRGVKVAGHVEEVLKAVQSL